MNNIIEITNLDKKFFLYNTPRSRLLHFLGLVKSNTESVQEYYALKNINLNIKKGEKLGIIGKNGSGKSTLLKILSGVLSKSSGNININGKIQSILEIGTGFYPDLSGRQNVRSYLIQMGLSGKNLEEAMDEVLDFAEVDEFLDQPIKFYSTGMRARLMFSTILSMNPDILILDEVLSVGDAYFVSKSFERINKLIKDGNKTLILVSHDLYSATKICDRFVLLDQGKILMDKKGLEVVHFYEKLIKNEEEQRILKRKITNIKDEKIKQVGSKKTLFGILPDRSKIFPKIKKIKFYDLKDPNIFYEIDYSLNEKIDDKINFVFDSSSIWLKKKDDENKNYLTFKNYGSITNKAEILIDDYQNLFVENNEVVVEIEYIAEDSLNFEINISNNNISFQDQSKFEKNTTKLELNLKILNNEKLEINKSAKYGVKNIEILNLEILNKDKNKQYNFEIYDEMYIKFDYEINDPNINEKSEVLISFYKSEDPYATNRYLLNNYNFNFKNNSTGSIILKINSLQNGPGIYKVNISIRKENYSDSFLSNKFFTISEGVYDQHNRLYEFKINHSNKKINNGVTFISNNYEWINDK